MHVRMNICVSMFMYAYVDMHFVHVPVFLLLLQSTLVISNSKGLSKILRDIRTSTYQIYRLQE